MSAARKPARRLLDWFDRQRRPLPWRRDREPYHVWVSEVMLQQTRVETVIPYYERFLERFPSVESLAAAGEDEVLAAWSGLGYYRRARSLRAAARELVAQGTVWPRSADAWLQLPGVGPCTAAAVSSIAFDQRVVALDGNVVRVLTRLAAVAELPDRASARRGLERLGLGLLDPERPGDGNQALMELGATVCLPHRPRCGDCPLAMDCRAYSAGNPERYPTSRAQPRSRREQRVIALVRRQGRVLLYRRPNDQRLLAGLWELPWVEGEPGGAAEGELAGRYGGRWQLLEPLASVRHAITTRRLEVAVWRAERDGGGEIAEDREAAWFEESELAAQPLGGLEKKALQAARTRA